MFKRIVSIIGGFVALGGLVTLLGAAPTIETPDKGNTYIVRFDIGAIFSCVVFRMVKATEPKSDTWPDGHYAPRSCGMLDPTSTNYVDRWSPYIWDQIKNGPYDVDWDVYAEGQYPVNGSNSEFTTVETNRVRIHR